jgi:hypothetical protein
MHRRFDRWRDFPFEVVVIAFVCIAVTFWLKARLGLNLADEGFRWYGTLHTALGEVPMRDFQSYDPGRYYWGALWFKILGKDGPVSLRLAEAGFQFIGMCFGLLVLRRRILKTWWALAAAGLVLWIWMGVYEPVIILAAISFGVRLIEQPSTRRHFGAGIFVGLAAFFGRNLGLYTAVAFFALILFIWFKVERGQLSKRLGIWLVGIIVGYLPMLAMIVFVPGFLHAVIEAVRFNLTVATRLPLPVPWPWTTDYSGINLGAAVKEFTIGMLYLLIPIFYVVALIFLLRTKHDLRRKSVLIACVFVGSAFLHYTFSRASFDYLAITIHPVLIGLMALPASFGPRQRKVLLIGVWAFIIIVSRVTVWEAGWKVHGWPLNAAINALAVERYHRSYDLAYQDYGLVRTNIRGQDLWLPMDQAKLVHDVTENVQQRMAPDENILIAPHWTTFYPILGKKSPVWEIYFLFPQSRSKQEEMINDLERKNVNWALICNWPLDGRDELRFSNTHSYMWQYLMENFEPVSVDTLPAECQCRHRKERMRGR